MKKKCMRKYQIIVLTLIIGSISIYGIHANQSKAAKMTDIMLANLEALTTEEKGEKFAERCSKTWDEGPFYDMYGKRYFVVYKKTDCFGTGVVDCEPDLSSEVVFE